LNNLINTFVLLLVISIFLSFPAKSNDRLAKTNLEKVIHEGDLIIQGDEVFFIENKEFYQIEGDIIVKDNGKIILRDTTFYFQEEYHEKYNWNIFDSGTVEIINSKIIDPYTHIMYIWDNSRVIVDKSLNNGTVFSVFNNAFLEIKNSTFNDGIDAFEFGREYKVGDCATIKVSDSDITNLTLNFFNESVVYLSEFVKGQLLDYWYFPGEGSYNIPYTIELKNTKVNHLDIRCTNSSKLIIDDSKIDTIRVADNTKVKVKNCSIWRIVLDLFGEFEINSLRPGHLEYFNMSSYGTGFFFDVEVINSDITGWFIDVYEGISIIKNSHLAYLNSWNNSSTMVYNSTIEGLYFQNFYGTIFFKDCIVDTWERSTFSDFIFKGTVEIKKAVIVDTRWGPCKGIFIHREFPIKTVPGSELVVYDSENNLLWQGFADDNGEAFFTLSFECSNYEDEYILKSEELGKERKFKLGSSTPLTFELGGEGGEDLLGTWTGQGVYYRNSDTGKWARVASSAAQVTAGNVDGDGVDDLIGVWPLQGGVWVKYSSTNSWSWESSSASFISAGDMNGDSRDDLLGTWSGQGVFYRDSVSGSWVKMATPATEVTAGDIDGDGIDDLIGIWPSQGGVWVKYSSSSSWARLSSAADWIGCGDMNGDGRDDLLGTWSSQGVFYKDSATGNWVKMATPATMTAPGDLDGDGTDDILGIWPAQGGVWVKYSSLSTWQKLASTADWISCGKMRVPGSTGLGALELSGPSGGIAEGPGLLRKYKDLSAEGPGGWNFDYKEEENITPQEEESVKIKRVPGPGETGFKYIREKNLIPQEKLINKKDKKL